MNSEIELPREDASSVDDGSAPEHGYQSGEALDIDPARQRDLLTHSRGAILAGVGQIVSKALNQMSAEMAELATKKVEDAEQRELLDAASVVDSKKSAVETSFTNHFEKIFDRQLGVDPVVEEDRPADQELALVDDSFIRDKLKRERLVNRTRNKLDSDEVLGIRARLGALINRDWFDESDHPAAPEFVYEALQKAIDSVGDVADVRTTLLEAFEPFVTANLNSVYAKVNTQLREQQVLPRIKPRVTVTPDSGRSNVSSTADTEDGIENLKRATGAPDEETFILPPAGPARESILQALASQVAEGGVQARSSAVRMLSEPRNFSGENAETAAPDDDLIATLDSLQSDSGVQTESEGKEALQKLSETTRGNGSPLDQLTVEIVSLIFDFLYDDPRIPQPIKTQLLRLQVVAVKAALLDRSFFASRQHPMRRLIDRTSELSCDPDTDASEGSNFAVGIGEIVDWILTAFDRDLDVFAQAVDRLTHLEESESDRRQSELAELTESASRTEAQAIAAENVRSQLMSRMDELTPAFVREFLQDWWSEVMIDVRMKADGNDPEAAAEHLIIAEQLIWSVVVTSSSEVNLMAPLLPKMIGGLNAGLARLSTPKDQHDAFFNELMKWHTKTIVTAKKRKTKKNEAPAPVGNVRMSSDGRVEFEKLQESEQTEPDTIINEGSVIDTLVKGQLLELHEEGAEPIAVKLAWVSPARKLFALSRFPDFARSVPRSEMVSMLESGRLIRVKAEATVDRAIHAVSTADDSGSAGRPGESASSAQAAPANLSTA